MKHVDFLPAMHVMRMVGPTRIGERTPLSQQQWIDQGRSMIDSVVKNVMSIESEALFSCLCNFF